MKNIGVLALGGILAILSISVWAASALAYEMEGRVEGKPTMHCSAKMNAAGNWEYRYDLGRFEIPASAMEVWSSDPDYFKAKFEQEWGSSSDLIRRDGSIIFSQRDGVSRFEIIIHECTGEMCWAHRVKPETFEQVCVSRR